MYNFGFNQDPLLFQNIVPKQNTYQDGNDLRQQYDAVITQYQALQQKIPPQQPTKDYLGELDALTREMEPDIIEKLSSDSEYQRINAELQYLIQEEMLKNVRWKINNNPDSRIDKMK